MRMRSSNGWELKSKPAKVLMLRRRPILTAALTRLSSRRVSSSSRNALIGPIPPADGMIENLWRPRHLQPDQGGRTFQDARNRLIAFHIRTGKPTSDGILEGRRAGGDGRSGRQLLLCIGCVHAVGRRRCRPTAASDAALAAPSSTGWTAISRLSVNADRTFRTYAEVKFLRSGCASISRPADRGAGFSTGVRGGVAVGMAG
jgi:hypothetical protein